MSNLQNTIALVTGGARGVGLGIAHALVDEGASVAIAARSTDELQASATALRKRGGRILPIQADVINRADVERMVSQAEAELGPLDLLVNNAGRNHCIGPLGEIDPDDWWRDVEVNLKGVMLCTHAVLPGMRERGRGVIVNVSSGLGLTPMGMVSSYSASKAAAIRLTECLAQLAEGSGVRFFSVSPGTVRTKLMDYIQNSEPARQWIPGAQEIPDEVWRDPAIMGRLVVRLAAGDADALSGRYLHVDDDLDALIARAEEIQEKDLLTLRYREVDG